MPADLHQGRFKDQLGDQLEAAARRRTEPRGLPDPLGASPGRQSSSLTWSRPKLALAAGFLIIVAGALALVAAPTSTSRAEANILEFTYEQDRTIVEVVDLVRDRAELESELEAAGLSFTLRAVPASPSMVGRIAGIRSEPDRIRISPPSGPIESFTVPSNYQGHLEITYGEEARGRPYEVSHEPSLCRDISKGHDAASVATLLQETGYRAQWLLDGEPVSTAEPFETFVVEDVVPINDHEALVLITTDLLRTPCTLN